MNLLEHYIEKIYSEKDITLKYMKNMGKIPSEPIIEVDLEYNCYGNIKRNIQIFSESAWKETKEKGYFMA